MSDEESNLAHPLAPEDIRRGDYVAVLHIVSQYLPFSCLEDATVHRTEPVSVTWLPRKEPQPLEVIEVCLPFVLVRKADGTLLTLDVRRHRLGRLSRAYAQRAMKSLGRSASTGNRTKRS